MQAGMVEFDLPSFTSLESTHVDSAPHVAWRRSQPQGGAAPNPRARFASCISEGTLWVHGGVCLNSRSFGLFGQSETTQDEICSFDIESQTWLRVVCSGSTSSPALQAHAVTPSGSDASILLVFGGLDENGKPSSSLHSIRTLDESRTLKSPAHFAMESEREDWRIKFVQEAQNHRTILEKFQNSHLECEDLKRRAAFLQTSCLNLERELVSRDEQLLRQRSVIQQMQQKCARLQEQLDSERSQHDTDAAAASSAAAAAAAVQVCAATAAAKASVSGGVCELQPHWMSWAWQQLLHAHRAAAASSAPCASLHVAKISTSSTTSIDDGDDWLGLGDLLGTLGTQPPPPSHHSGDRPPASAPPAASAPAAAAAVPAAEAAHLDDNYSDASLMIQLEVEEWVRGVAGCDHLGIMVRRTILRLCRHQRCLTMTRLQLQRGVCAASAPADAPCRVCSSYGFFTPGPNSRVMLLHFQNRVVVSFFTLCFAGDAPSSAALPDVCDMPTAWEQLTTEFVPLMAFGL
jgi:hypothetical protein